MGESSDAETSKLATALAELVGSAGLSVAVAESLTGGALASALAQAPESSTLLRADVAVAVTGAGGPQGQEDQPPGTVFLALTDGQHTQVEHRYLEADDPTEVCQDRCRGAATARRVPPHRPDGRRQAGVSTASAPAPGVDGWSNWVR